MGRPKVLLAEMLAIFGLVASLSCSPATTRRRTSLLGPEHSGESYTDLLTIIQNLFKPPACTASIDRSRSFSKPKTD
uniref:Uncharacterized protein n=1 Tax=Oryza glumipatula TaxID=40148 RepID=A0A0D9ZCB5_9ORYZ